jgi:hypothetical protein
MHLEGLCCAQATNTRIVTSKPAEPCSPSRMGSFSFLFRHGTILSSLILSLLVSTVSLWNLASDHVWASQEALMNYSTKKTEDTSHKPRRLNQTSHKTYMCKFIMTITRGGHSDWCCQPHGEQGMGLLGVLVPGFISLVLLIFILRCL